MAFSYTNSKGRTYYLHSKEVALRGGRQQTIYFFSKDVKPGALHVLPSGKIVVENSKTGLPILKGAEKKQGIGNSDVMTGEKVKISEPTMVESEPQESKNGMQTEEMVEEKTTMNVEEKLSKPEKVPAPQAKAKRKSKTSPSAKSNTTNNLLPLIMLPGQLLVVATANLIMNRLSGKTAQPEEEL